MSTKKQLALSIALVALAAIVVILARRNGSDSTAAGGAAGHDQMAAGSGGDAKSPVRLDAESARRIGVTFATAERQVLDRSVRTVGTVTYDETRLANVSPKIEGWVERLYVDFTGAPVTRGQALLELYSPQLVSAQEELILARRLADEAAADPESRSAERARRLLDASRRRLAYWDIAPAQIDRVERSGEPQKTLTLRAPASGIVVEKGVVEGSRVAPGMNLYRIADLSIVWVEGEVFEKDLSLVRVGQRARITFEAYPGEAFQGTVTYVYPSVTMEARTGRVRIELANPGLRLKPGMYAEVNLEVLGGSPALVVPRAAVHATGERSYVFVREADGSLAAREVTPGLVAGSRMEILAGLTEGESVVSSANFLIDAESSMGAAIGSMPGMEMED
jgi:Cu(I)/Ag(I) efflux system membrane fusion protein